MPCYTVNLVSVQFQVKHLDLLKQAATKLGLSVYERGTTIVLGTMEYNTTTEQIRGRQEQINLLKREYSETAVKAAAKKHGWSLQQKTEKKWVAMKF